MTSDEIDPLSLDRLHQAIESIQDRYQRSIVWVYADDIKRMKVDARAEGRRAGLEEAADLCQQRRKWKLEGDNRHRYNYWKIAELKRRAEKIKQLEKAIRALADKPAGQEASDG